MENFIPFIPNPSPLNIDFKNICTYLMRCDFYLVSNLQSSLKLCIISIDLIYFWDFTGNVCKMALEKVRYRVENKIWNIPKKSI